MKKPTSQKQAVLNLLLKGRKLNINNCRKLTGCTSVGRRVSDFRKLGFVFKQETITFKTKQGTKGRCVNYSIDFKKTPKKLWKKEK